MFYNGNISKGVNKMLVKKKSPINITHINTQDIPGGAAKIAERLMKSQRKKGYNSNFLVGYKYSNEIDSVPFSITRDIKIAEEVYERQLLYYDFIGSNNLISHPLFTEADLIHMHNLHGDFFNPFSLSLLSHKKPIVWTLHDMQAITGHCSHSLDCEQWEEDCSNCSYLDIYPSISRDSSKELLNDKKMIYEQSFLTLVTPSDWLKEKVKKSILGKFDVVRVYNGIDVNVFQPFNKQAARVHFNLPQDKIIIIGAANYGVFKNPFKGGLYTKQTIDYLKNSFIDFVFVNIGSKNLIQKDPFIIEIPHIYDEKELALLYSAADIFITTSLAETFGLVVAEAMACGLPAVSFNTGGIPEIIRHGETGFISNYKDSEQLGSYILELAKNKELREKFSTNSRKRIITMFSHDQIENKYEEIYFESINNKMENNIKYFPLDKIPSFLNDCESFIQSEKNKTNILKTKKPSLSLTIILNLRGKSPEESETYHQLVNNIGGQFEIKLLHGTDDTTFLNNIKSTYVYYIEDGTKIVSNFKNVINNIYSDSDIICFGLEVLNKKSNRFYKYVLPRVFNKDGFQYVDTKILECIVFKMEYFTKSLKNIMLRVEIKSESVDIFHVALVQRSINDYIHGKLEIGKHKKIYIYGAGEHTEALIENVYLSNVNIKGIFDQNKKLEGRKIGSYPIISLDNLKELPIDKVIISSANYEREIYHYLKRIIPKENIITIYGGFI